MSDRPARVVVALSGGVDSAVAAALLVDQGHAVIAVMLRLWAEEQNRCCAPEAVDDARRVAAQLSIPFYLLDSEVEFKARVVGPFIAGYARGRTPNPCLACNGEVRFHRLLRQAQVLDAPFVATGHYARILPAGDRLHLCTAADRHKDQSYVLYMLGQEELRRLRFPLGEYTKAEVRETARRRGLAVADREESMDLCFAAGGDYRRFLRRHAPQALRAGPIVDTAGRQIGQHQGLPLYTVGQRRGLGIAAPQALYVIRLDPAANALVVGPARELGGTSLTAEEVSYVGGQPPHEPLSIHAKIRHQAAPAAATWTPVGRTQARVDFRAPVRDITPGQAVVAYQGESVLGGGIIGP